MLPPLENGQQRQMNVDLPLQSEERKSKRGGVEKDMCRESKGNE